MIARIPLLFAILFIAGCTTYHGCGGCYSISDDTKIYATFASSDTTLDQELCPKIPVSVLIVYPSTLKRQGISGTAEIEIEVSSAGLVTAVRPLSGTHPDFIEASVTGIKKGVFYPAHRNGAPASVIAKCKFVFEIVDE